MTEPPFLEISNWRKHQHYHTRGAPWIKLYTKILNNPDFIQLPEAAQAQLMKLWVLASQIGHPLPNNPRLLAGKIGATGRFYLASIIAAGFIVPCEQGTENPLEESEINASKTSNPLEQRTEVESRERDVVDGPRAREGVPVPGEPALTALYLTVWCNKAIDEHWTAPRNSFVPAQSEQLAAALVKAGVEWQVARASIFDQCRASKADEPPRHPNYFAKGVLGAWKHEQDTRTLAVVGDVAAPPVPRNTTRMNKLEQGRANIASALKRRAAARGDHGE